MSQPSDASVHCLAAVTTPVQDDFLLILSSTWPAITALHTWPHQGCDWHTHQQSSPHPVDASAMSARSPLTPHMPSNTATTASPDHALRPATSCAPRPAIGLLRVHLPCLHQRATCSFEVTRSWLTVAVSGVKHRVISHQLRGFWSQAPTALPLNYPHRLLSVRQVVATGPVALAAGSAGRDIELTQLPDRPLRCSLGIGQT